MGGALEQKNSHLKGREDRVVVRVTVIVSGGVGSSKGVESSCETVKDAVGGVSSMLVERWLRRTGRGTST